MKRALLFTIDTLLLFFFISSLLLFSFNFKFKDSDVEKRILASDLFEVSVLLNDFNCELLESVAQVKVGIEIGGELICGARGKIFKEGIAVIGKEPKKVRVWIS